MKVREAIAAIEADGWRVVKVTGDHRHYKHPTKPGRVTIPGHLNDDLHPKTRDSIFRQAGLPKPKRQGGDRRAACAISLLSSMARTT